MKYILTWVFFIAVFGIKAQTVIPYTTTIDSLTKMAKGAYRFLRPSKDTVDLSLDSSIVVTVYIHDTIPRVCPVCPVCPTCPPPGKQRTATGLIWGSAIQRWTILYDDGSQTNL